MNFNDDLELNAYIDGELTPDQQAELLEAMRTDPDFARRACELSRLKAQLNLAYAAPPRAKQRIAEKVNPSWRRFAAGFALVAFGLIGGWLLHAGVPVWIFGESRFVVLDPSGRGQTAAVAAKNETRIVFHLTSPDQAVAGELLDEVEAMLVAYQTDGRPLRVEIVSHGEGLNLLRERLSQHKARIHALATRYSNLTFVACSNTIQRLAVENGIEVQLIPDVEVIDSGITHVVKRQREGWSYIRV
ncbi:MAG: DsrE family protein [Chromatiaceae bacterium]|nr:DsrE family protein [Chromatiaceae bacterium]